MSLEEKRMTSCRGREKSKKKERQSNKWKSKRHSLSVWEWEAESFQVSRNKMFIVHCLCVCVSVLRSVGRWDAEDVFWVLQSSYKGCQTLQRAAGQRQETSALYTGKNKNDQRGCLSMCVMCLHNRVRCCLVCFKWEDRVVLSDEWWWAGALMH